MKTSISFIASALLLASMLVGCAKNPVTGRRSLQLVPESEMRSTAVQQYSSFLAENKVVQGNADAEMVKRIGNRMSEAVKTYLTSKGQADLIDGYQWEFNLVNNDQVNAWCMPGGKVVVYTGIMPVAQNEAGLAVVMGHEIAHAIAKHGNERVSQQMAAQGLGIGLQLALSSKPTQTQQIWNTAYGVGSQVGLLKYSRTQESEADEMGLIFMALAGYNPDEAVNFWTRMSVKGQGSSKPPEFLSTHPSDNKRIADIKKWLPEARKYYKPK